MTSIADVELLFPEQYWSTTLHTCEDQDKRCLGILHSVRIGETGAVYRAIKAILHYQMYAGASPSWRGFHDLLHVFDRLLSETRNTKHETLVATCEANSYNPEMCKVENQERAELAYQSLYGGLTR